MTARTGFLRFTLGTFLLALVGIGPLIAQDAEPPAAPRGSIMEDRAAQKLIEAGDMRLEAEESEKALEIWRSVIERYPRSRVRFDAHMRLGTWLLEQKRAFDEARGHFEAVTVEDNPDDEQRAEATLNTGVCFYEGRHYGQCFKILREVIEEFPTSEHVNSSWYYIGLGHFKLGHYSRAIEALEKVGTSLSEEDTQFDKVEAGKRLFVKIDDNDLAILDPEETILVTCRVASGDEEEVECFPLGRQVRVVLGSVTTELGSPIPGDGKLQVQGGDEIEVIYVDQHTAAKEFDQQRLFSVAVVGTAEVAITDGSFANEIAGVVIGKSANLQVVDADFDRTHDADTLRAVAEVWREKSQEEQDEEIAAMAARGELPDPNDPEAEAPEIERYKKIDEVAVTLTEVELVPILEEMANEEAEVEVEVEEPTPAEGEVAQEAVAAEDGESEPVLAEPVGIHTGVFRGLVPVVDNAAPVGNDQTLQAQTGDLVRLRYQDELNLTRDAAELVATAQAIEGNLGNVRVTKTDIADTELRIRTQLRTAEALTNIGNHYREFGLKDKAQNKYGEALEVAEAVLDDARRLGGTVLEQAYVQLWRTYFAMGDYGLAVAMSQRLMREFPESTFVDEAMLQQANAFRESGDLPQAIQLYQSVLRLNQSPLKGEAQFGIAEAYEKMANEASENQADQLFERAFTEYQKVYEQFPDSGRVGDAVAKMANFYYQKEDYARAIDVFENVLSDYPDANFLDVILFNYGRCLYRLERRGKAREMFDQLINEFPESPVAGEAKRISDALAKAGF